MGDAVLLEYCGEISPAFSPVFQFLLSCDLMWPDLFCITELLNGSDADRLKNVLRC